MACFETCDTVEYTSGKVIVKVEKAFWNKNVIAGISILVLPVNFADHDFGALRALRD